MSEPRTLPAPTGTPYRIAFVCLGNICRSPMADVVLSELLDRAGLATKVEVSSCGTGTWHLGEPMDPRAAAQLRAEGYDASAHRAQKFDDTWLGRDLVLAMDAKNLAEISNGAGVSDRIRMFRSFDPSTDGARQIRPTSTCPTPSTAATTTSWRSSASSSAPADSCSPRSRPWSSETPGSWAAMSSAGPTGPYRCSAIVPTVGTEGEHP